MSRGFVREGDQEEPIIIPPRAPLPAGVINYVTPFGLGQLKLEREALEQERASITTTDETERRRAIALITGKLNLLQERILSARVLDPADQPADEVRFGATVSYHIDASKAVHTFQIVGVDEADVQKKKIAFIAPIARALTSHKVGDVVDFKLGNQTRKLEILKIEYQ